MHERRALCERGLRVGDGRQLLVLDLDELRRVLGGGAAGCDDDGDAVADVACLIGRERKMRRRIRVLGRKPRARQAAVPVLGEVVSRPGGDDLGVRERGPDVDAADPRVREGAPHDGEIDHARQPHVVDPLGLPAEERHVLLALDRRTDDVARRDLRRRAHPAAA